MYKWINIQYITFKLYCNHLNFIQLYEELPRCAGIITSIELSSGADARGSYTFVKLKDHLHEMWTELERLRMPIILAYYKKFHVIIHSAYCHKEEYKFEVITFVRYDYECK